MMQRLLWVALSALLVGCAAPITTAPQTATVQNFKSMKATDTLTYEQAYQQWQACLAPTVVYQENDVDQVLVVCKTPQDTEIAMLWKLDSPTKAHLVRVVAMNQYDQEYSGNEVAKTKEYEDALIHNTKVK